MAPSVEFRFGVDDRTAKLVEINSPASDDQYEDIPGGTLEDLQAVPAAHEGLEGFDGIDTVEPVDETVAEITAVTDSIVYKD